MQIVSDRGADLSQEQLKGLGVHFVPLKITLEGTTYLGGEDLSSEEFYKLLSNTQAFPTTSQPSPGDFAELYRKLAQIDPEILSIHISSGLSGTVESARLGAAMVPEAKIHLVDTKTLSCPEGWQVEAAAKAVKAGWPLDRILDLLKTIGEKSEGLFTLSDLRYLIHGGRISHLKGLVASLLNIKPVIGVDHESGKYVSLVQEVTLKRAIQKMVDFAGKLYAEGTKFRIQPLHGYNPAAVESVIQSFKQNYDCVFEAITPVAPVLGAHTGPSLVGFAIAPLDIFEPLGG
ncbi:MAG: DegV family protein [Anaerolineaceae bacterium]|nr:DegV family protein [Anaerolineaceae bacterium]